MPEPKTGGRRALCSRLLARPSSAPAPRLSARPADARTEARANTRASAGAWASARTGVGSVAVLLAGLGLLSFASLSADAITLATETPRAERSPRSHDGAPSESLAEHPPAARRAALILAGQPEVLLEIDRLQQESAGRFRALIAPYPRRDQQQIWSLVRYPGLAAALAGGGRKSSAQLEAIAERFPPEERAAILEQGEARYPLWVEIHALELETRQRVARMLSARDPRLLQAFDELESRPALLALLIDNIRWTTRLGAEYREEPLAVEQRLSALAAEIEARRREDERDWAEQLADPGSAEEIARATQAFAETFEYAPEAPESPAQERERQVTVDETGRRTRTLAPPVRTSHAHPYWLGAPEAWDGSLWAPLPLSYHAGFRSGRGVRGDRRFVPVGLPSLFFLRWYHDVYRHRAQPGSGASVRYYETHRPRLRRSREPSAGILRRSDEDRPDRRGAEDASAGGRRTSTAGDSTGRESGRESRADATTLPLGTPRPDAGEAEKR